MRSEPAPAVSPPGGEVFTPSTHDAVPPGEAGPENSLPEGLSRREHEMLAFERQWWRRPGAKETAIRDRFGVPPTRYYQVLNALVDRPAALVADPLLVRRLRRMRSARGLRRSSRHLGNGGSAD